MFWRTPRVRSSRRRSAAMRERARRRSVSIWVSPGPLVAIPPPVGAAEALEVRPQPPHAGHVVLELGQLDLQLALGRAGVVGEDVQDHRGAVDHRRVDGRLEVALLPRRQLVVDGHEVGVAGLDRLLELGQLALAEVAVGVGRGALLGHLAGHGDAGRAQQLAQLGQVVLVRPGGDQQRALACSAVADPVRLRHALRVYVRCRAVKVFVTGATGFIGGRMTRLLAERGDEVDRAGARSGQGVGAGRRRRPAAAGRPDLPGGDRAGRARRRGGHPRRGDLQDRHHRAPSASGMFDANVRGTARVLDAAIEANVPRIVYVSSVVAFGDTEGTTVDRGPRPRPTAASRRSTRRPRCWRTRSPTSGSPAARRS